MTLSTCDRGAVTAAPLPRRVIERYREGDREEGEGSHPIDAEPGVLPQPTSAMPISRAALPGRSDSLRIVAMGARQADLVNARGYLTYPSGCGQAGEERCLQMLEDRESEVE
jgi:hypothetical protein